MALEDLFQFHMVGQFIVGGALLATVVASLITYCTSRGRINRTIEMTKIVRRMADGDYSQRVPLVASASTQARSMSIALNGLSDALQRAERQRQELVANLSHELRTPLTNIQGYVEALRDGVIDASAEALESVHEEVLRLVRLVDALQQLAHADTLLQQLPPGQPTDLDAMTRHLSELIKPQAEERRVRVHVSLGARSTPVGCQPDSVAIVMRNLLKNAVQYTDEGGQIRISTEVHGSFYRFTCLNSGPGIAPEEMPHIFRRFYRTKRGVTSVRSGVGIGLAIAREIVEAHGGAIGADSADGWTIVWFEIPVS